MVDFDSIKGSNSKVALYPQPKGVIQFIGGFISGSFPEVSFRHLFQDLYDQGYSLIVYHFSFNPLQFNHWSVAIEILEDLYQVRFQIIKQLFCSTASEQQLDFYGNDANYFWLGYSLGCKYILLLEILSNDHDNFQRRNEILRLCLREEYLQKTYPDISRADSVRESVINKISEILGSPYQLNPFIKDQPSLLLAPEINNTFEIFNTTISPFKYLDFPSREEIQCLIRNSTDFFNLMGLISFDRDIIARDDVDFLQCQLQNKAFQPVLHQVLEGTHSKPLETDVENLVCCIDLILQELKQRQRFGVSKAVQCEEN